jgi:hypothetical protein
VKQSSPLEAMHRYILVVPAHDWKFAEDRVAVMRIVHCGVAAVSEIAPHRICQKFVLRGSGPVLVPLREACMKTDHFLQEHEIGLERLQALAQLMQAHTPLELRKPFVDVIGEYVEALHALVCL